MATLQHFKITGTVHATSARRTIELDAPNRAAAEKQAHLEGVDEILRVEQVADDPAQDALSRAPRVTHRGEFDDGAGKARWIAALVLIALLIAAAAVMWLRTRA
jgi:hypothetical protein